jgi:hypothetical protein
MSDNREKPRVEFDTTADVRSQRGEISAGIKDLSMKGLFFFTREKFIEGDELDIRVKLSGSTTELTIDVKGIVERTAPDGVGVLFKEMELDSFIHLRNIVFYADRELQEFYEFI